MIHDFISSIKINILCNLNKNILSNIMNNLQYILRIRKFYDQSANLNIVFIIMERFLLSSVFLPNNLRHALSICKLNVKHNF